MSRKRFPLGGWLIVVLIASGYYALRMLSSTTLLWYGVAAQGVIVNEQGIRCGKSSSGQEFSVQFTDQTTGLAATSTISQCDYSDFNASPGDKVAIVYLPDDPSQIAPPDGLLANVKFFLIMSILCGLITLILLPLWIRKRIRMASLQRQEDRAAAERWMAMEGHLANLNGTHLDWDSKS